MLGDIGRRDQELGNGNGVVRKEEDGKDTLHIWVGIDDMSNIDDETDGEFRGIVSGGRLPCKKDCTGHNFLTLLWLQGFDGEVTLRIQVNTNRSPEQGSLT